MMTEDNQSEETTRNTGPEDFSDRIVPDPENPNVKRLEGFVMGRSSIEENWRLYLAPDMDHYVEFRKEDTLHAEQISPTKAFVWITPRAEIKEVMLRSGPVGFLRGTIINEHVRRRGLLSAPQLGGPFRLFAVAANDSGCAAAGGCNPPPGTELGGECPTPNIPCPI